jgi:tRNA G37 N-methylase Trm5
MFTFIYDIILDQLFAKYNGERKKRVYKAAHLVMQLLDQSTDFIEDFLKLISKYIQRIDVYYSYFPEDITPRI